jgi:Spy/CpxP family protein refolding chaperone
VIRGSLIVLALASLVVALAGPPVAAQPKGDAPMMGIGRPQFLDELYRPEMLMRSQGELGLTAEQRTSITDAIKATQDRLNTLQWDLAAKNETVAKLVAPDHIDVEAALAAASQTIDFEGQIKKEHLKLLLQIKNLLTPAQIAKLRAQRQDRCRDDRPGPPGMPGHAHGHGGPPPDDGPLGPP